MIRRRHFITLLGGAAVRRREFITLLGGAATWPLTAQAQQDGRMRRVGVLLALAERDPETKARVAKFCQDDVFQRAVNYLFTGKVDPKDGPEIVDRESCIIVVPERKFDRCARYYLNRFKMDVARVSKKYAGRQALYQLEVEGDDVIFEYLKACKNDSRLRVQVCPHFLAWEY